MYLLRKQKVYYSYALAVHIFQFQRYLLRLSKKAIYYVFPLVDDSLKYPIPGVGHRKKFVFVDERQSVDPL